VDPAARRRAGLLGVFFCAIFLALLFKLYAIQILDHDSHAARRRIQSTGRIAMEIPRGAIYDVRGQVLAVSVPVESVWANPSVLSDVPAAARMLSGVLGLREGELVERLSRKRLLFTWIKRRVSPAEVEAVRNLAGQPPFKMDRSSPERKLGLLTEFKRQYPHGPLLGNVIGFESADLGQDEGLERSLAAFLTSPSRSFTVAKDGKRQVMGAAPVDLTGVEAHLTIDVLLQKVVEEELDVMGAEYHPRWAVALVMDPRTGAILALANRPPFDPNAPGNATPDSRLNRAVAAPIEPGSTLKPFVAATAIDLGLAKPETKIDCEMGLWKHGPRLLHDHHPYGTLMLAEVIKFSSNIGAAKIGALILGQKRLYECMQRWGFGERTGVDLPAEDGGQLFPLSRWTVYSETSVPMGHEISVTPIQLVAAMSAIANGGTLYRPYMVRRVNASDGTVLVEGGPHAVRRVIGEKASREMIKILESVVEGGTGKKAQVAGIRVAGKTGTSQKVDPRTRQYGHDKYISSFVGFAPADDARLCVAVIVDEPQGAYYGGAVAAPVAGRIIQRGLVCVK
jgi:cell division protein FtsI (penicillin-binding protein 3)